MSAEHAQLVEARWTATGGNNPLRGFGDFQGVYDSIPNNERLIAAIYGADRYVVCIDERLIGSVALPTNRVNYVRMAGEGILNPHAQEDLKRLEVSGIISHLDCGAKRLYANGREGNPDNIGLVAVIDLSERSRIPIIRVITSGDFRMPIHDARAVYYDGTEGGRFDWGRVEGFPTPGFIISRGILSDSSYAQKEVDVAISIAQGDHGFGRRFTDQSPLYLVAITDGQPGSVGMVNLRRELTEVAAKNQAVAVNLVLAS